MMKTTIKIKALLIFITLINFGKMGFSQEKKLTKQEELVMPDSYYKARAEKIKYAETHKPGAVSTGTATTFNSQNIKKSEVDNPEVYAKQMLNTTIVPSDFPTYSPLSSSKEYEIRVSAWFKKNPSFRKINK